MHSGIYLGVEQDSRSRCGSFDQRACHTLYQSEEARVFLSFRFSIVCPKMERHSETEHFGFCGCGSGKQEAIMTYELFRSHKERSKRSGKRVVITQEICYTPGETQTQHTKKEKKTFEATPSHSVRGGSKGFSLCTHQMSLQEAPRSHLLALSRQRSHTLPPTKKPRFPVALRDFPGCTLGHVPLSETSIARPFRFVKSCVVSWRTKLW